MSGRRPFSIPYKSPLHSKKTSTEQIPCQKTPQNQDVIRTPAAPRKLKMKTKRKRSPGTPKTPSFKLYGIKSPCRRRILGEDVCRYSFKSPKNQTMMGSQSTTPGRSPGQLLSNFEARIRRATSPPEERVGQKLETSPSAESVREAHRKLCQQTIAKKAASRFGMRSRNASDLAVYNLPLSPDSIRRRKEILKREKAKRHVLKVLRQTAEELKGLREKHRLILEQLSAVKSFKTLRKSDHMSKSDLRTSLVKGKATKISRPVITIATVNSQSSSRGNEVSSQNIDKKAFALHNKVEMMLDSSTQEVFLTNTPPEE